MSAFSSIELFYELDERRRYSPQWSYGSWWRWQGETFLLSWVADTGELVALRLGHLPQDRKIRIATHAAGITVLDGEPMEVYVLAVLPERALVEAALKGWADEYEGSLGWVNERVAEHRCAA